eukprot:6642253-Ditylum_brightwellii.AAC.1
MKARRKGLEKCCKIYISGITSHPKIKRTRVRIQLIEMIQERQKGGTSIRWDTKARQEFYKLKCKCGPLRSMLIEDKVAAMNLKGKEKEAKKLSSKLASKRERERGQQDSEPSNNEKIEQASGK